MSGIDNPAEDFELQNAALYAEQCHADSILSPYLSLSPNQSMIQIAFAGVQREPRKSTTKKQLAPTPAVSKNLHGGWLADFDGRPRMSACKGAIPGDF